MKRNPHIVTFFRPEQVCKKDIQARSFSKSPLKPLLLMNHLMEQGFEEVLEIQDDFRPFERSDFLTAHTQAYVDDFFEGGALCETNGLPWSPELVESVRYTNSSLYHAILHCCEHPYDLTFSPTSGFHHSTPGSGSGFCTFSGQVIASLKLYREKGLVGAYLDLDGHFGNSIGDSLSHFPEVEKAIRMNINPRFSHAEYLRDFETELDKLLDLVRSGQVDYLVWCHGADSHEWDDLGYQCTTAEWVKASEMFFTAIRDLERALGRCIPVTISLFGGYRADDYASVLSLHATDLQRAAQILLEVPLEYETKVKAKKIRKESLSLDHESPSSQVA